MPAIQYTIQPTSDVLIVRKVKTENTEVQIAKVVCQEVLQARQGAYGERVVDRTIEEARWLVAYKKSEGLSFNHAGVKYIVIKKSDVLFKYDMNEIVYDND